MYLQSKYLKGYSDNTQSVLTLQDLAYHILGVAKQYNIFVTNLQLQKVLYFTFKYCLKKKLFTRKQLTSLYVEPFQVWAYGAVIQSLYEKYKIYGSYPITEEHTLNPNFMKLNSVIYCLLKQDPYNLVRKSQSEYFWQRNKVKLKGWRSDISYSLFNIKYGC